MFSCEFCEVFKNTYFAEHLGTVVKQTPYISVAHFWPVFPFIPPENTEKPSFPGIFRCYEMGIFTRIGLICSCLPWECLALKVSYEFSFRQLVAYGKSKIEEYGNIYSVKFSSDQYEFCRKFIDILFYIFVWVSNVWAKS